MRCGDVYDEQILFSFMNNQHSSNAVYGFGFIGALVYFLGHASSFWMGVLGVLKAIVWPAIFVYHIFAYLHL